jgi:hypothetical protein
VTTDDSVRSFVDSDLKPSSAARKGLLAALPPPSVADSYTGLVSFTGLALLGCPEPVLKSRAVDLVAQIYIGSPTIDFLSSLCGSLRYFNSDRIIFSYGPSELYLIQGTVIFRAVVCLSHSPDFLLLDCSGAIERIQLTVLATGLRLHRGHSFGHLQSCLIGYAY